MLSTLDTFGRDGDAKMNSAQRSFPGNQTPTSPNCTSWLRIVAYILCIFALSLIREAVRLEPGALIIGKPYKDLFFPETNPSGSVQSQL